MEIPSQHAKLNLALPLSGFFFVLVFQTLSFEAATCEKWPLSFQISFYVLGLH